MITNTEIRNALTGALAIMALGLFASCSDSIVAPADDGKRHPRAVREHPGSAFAAVLHPGGRRVGLLRHDHKHEHDHDVRGRNPSLRNDHGRPVLPARRHRLNCPCH
jgi:hypothetical protein